MTAVLVATVVVAASGGGRAPRRAEGRAEPGARVAPRPGRRDAWVATTAVLDALLPDPAVRRELAGSTVYQLVGNHDTRPACGTCVLTAKFDSYQALTRAHLGAAVRAVLLDLESWTSTPVAEQRAPARFYEVAGRLVHREHRLFIAAPGLDLFNRAAAGSGRSDAAVYLDSGLLRAIARDADVLVVQSQSRERRPAGFAALLDRAAAEVAGVNPHVTVLGGISTNPSGRPVTAVTIERAMRLVGPAVGGYWVNIPGRGALCPGCGTPRPGVALAVLEHLPGGLQPRA